MYKIPNSKTLNQIMFKQIRLGLQAAPNTGKTTAALTAPNPVVADFDRKVSASNAINAGKKLEDITIIPFYEAAFVDSLVPRSHPIFSPNKRDAFTKWLSTEAVKLQEDQTLIIDSWTMLQAGFDQQQSYEPAVSKKGAEDKFVFWAAKIDYAKNVMERLKTLNCNVIVTFHESVERDEDGKPTGKCRPVMQGAFADQIAGHFTDYFRCHAEAKAGQPTTYLWQVAPDNSCNCGTHLSGLKPRVPATWDIFVNPDKYKV